MKNPAVALDIETTGLDEKYAELLSLSFVLETPESFKNLSPVRELPYLSLVFIKEGPLTYLEEAAGAMNAKLLKLISDYRTKRKEEILTSDKVYQLIGAGSLSFDYFRKTLAVTPEAGMVLINEFLKTVRLNYGLVELFGKNIGKFDLQVIQNYLDRNVQGGRQVFREMILEKTCSYRYGDLGTMFWPFFKEMVSLSKIVSLFGEKTEVDHVAYEDGVDSVKSRRLALVADERGIKTIEGLTALALELK